MSLQASLLEILVLAAEDLDWSDQGSEGSEDDLEGVNLHAIETLFATLQLDANPADVVPKLSTFIYALPYDLTRTDSFAAMTSSRVGGEPCSNVLSWKPELETDAVPGDWVVEAWHSVLPELETDSEPGD